jgi:phage gpG-like protein
MIPSFAENFASEGRPPWQELAEYTVKRRGGATGPILQRTGAMLSDALSFDIWTITKTAASVQRWPQHSWYANIHQAGYGSAAGTTGSAKSAAAALARGETKQAAKIHIPARPFIMFQEDDVVQIRAIFFDWLTEKADEVGRLR